MIRRDARAAILDAASVLAREGGAAALGVDRIVTRAGVSKGASFHYFAGKETMLAALLEDVAAAFDQALQARLAAGHRFGPALVETTSAEVERNGTLIPTLVAAIVSDPRLAAMVAASTGEWQRPMIGDGVPPGRAELVRLAIDGLMMASALDTAPAGARLAAVRIALPGLVRNG
ncbi:TetR/AcrR family transcriptional regulator [Roseomonas sp. CCTCC AB2023176]|uniref:TetR/AcrR family transcriptional regulator n=1 Tax=Roseomonas sp. CCTCC AB2023176 TaxID=3342640 RepID=UPI0035D9DDA0